MAMFGPRKPSVKKRISARTTGKAKRAVKSTYNPTYGKKGTGFAKNPEKSIYNKVYNETTYDAIDYTDNSSGELSDGLGEIYQLLPFVIVALPLSIIGINMASGFWLFLSWLFAIISGVGGILILLTSLILIALHPIISLFFMALLGIVFDVVINFLGFNNHIILYIFIGFYVVAIVLRFILIAKNRI